MRPSPATSFFESILTVLALPVAAAITGFFGWLVYRRKASVEVSVLSATEAKTWAETRHLDSLLVKEARATIDSLREKVNDQDLLITKQSMELERKEQKIERLENRIFQQATRLKDEAE